MARAPFAEAVKQQPGKVIILRQKSSADTLLVDGAKFIEPVTTCHGEWRDPQSTMTRADTALGFAVLAALGAVTYDRLYETWPMKPVTGPLAPEIDKSPRKQAQRQELVAHLIDLGVFHKVESVSPTLVRVYVMPRAFNRLRFETKQTYLGVAFTGRFEDMAAGKQVHVIDATDGKRLGYYSPALGGLSLE